MADLTQMRACWQRQQRPRINMAWLITSSTLSETRNSRLPTLPPTLLCLLIIALTRSSPSTGKQKFRYRVGPITSKPLSKQPLSLWQKNLKETASVIWWACWKTLQPFHFQQLLLYWAFCSLWFISSAKESRPYRPLQPYHNSLLTRIKWWALHQVRLSSSN